MPKSENFISDVGTGYPVQSERRFQMLERDQEEIDMLKALINLILDEIIGGNTNE